MWRSSEPRVSAAVLIKQSSLVVQWKSVGGRVGVEEFHIIAPSFYCFNHPPGVIIPPLPPSYFLDSMESPEVVMKVCVCSCVVWPGLVDTSPGTILRPCQCSGDNQTTSGENFSYNLIFFNASTVPTFCGLLLLLFLILHLPWHESVLFSKELFFLKFFFKLTNTGGDEILLET